MKIIKSLSLQTPFLFYKPASPAATHRHKQVAERTPKYLRRFLTPRYVRGAWRGRCGSATCFTSLSLRWRGKPQQQREAQQQATGAFELRAELFRPNKKQEASREALMHFGAARRRWEHRVKAAVVRCCHRCHRGCVPASCHQTTPPTSALSPRPDGAFRCSQKRAVQPV